MLGYMASRRNKIFVDCTTLVLKGETFIPTVKELVCAAEAQASQLTVHAHDPEGHVWRVSRDSGQDSVVTFQRACPWTILVGQSAHAIRAGYQTPEGFVEAMRLTLLKMEDADSDSESESGEPEASEGVQDTSDTEESLASIVRLHVKKSSRI